VVPVHVERDGHELLHRQVYHELVQLIRSGRMQPAVRLPSSRVLADELGVARNNVSHSGRAGVSRRAH
jgi:GntR family transcriptional regulator/MocR family aminotransferase